MPKLFGFLAYLALVLFSAAALGASPSPGKPSETADKDCLACHANPRLQSASGKSVAVDPATIGGSIHGEAGTACVDCHADLRRNEIFPHASKLQRVDCSGCHEKEAQALSRSAHPSGGAGRASSGVTCADCHGSHDIRAVTDPASRVSRKNIIAACGRCHEKMQKDYLEGVHGKAYGQGSADVPACTDCHSGHDIRPSHDEQSNLFATKVAAVCSRCHDDVKLAKTYGFLAGRMMTYSRSYHGAAARFGAVRVANCASCHGFHDVRPSSDPRSSVYPGNIPKTCGTCHPGATTNFADGQIHALTGPAVPARYKLPDLIRRIYVVLITAVVSIALVFIGADLFHRLIGRKDNG